MKKRKISLLWWPVLLLFAPFIGVFLLIKNITYQKNRRRAEKMNRERISSAVPLDLPEVNSLDLTVLVDEKTAEGYMGEAGISYLFQTDTGSMLYDIGFGEDRGGTLVHNAAKKGITFQTIDALTISHLHPDHMGGMKASRKNEILVPESLGKTEGKMCYLPSKAKASNFTSDIVTAPRILTASIGSTGPLARSLFFFGYTEEQALLVNLKGKGLVIITGCGHPTIEVILEMCAGLSKLPVYAIIGGLHFPLSRSRGAMLGLQPQMFIGTGLPPWKSLTSNALNGAISAINKAAPEYVYLSPHDSCDYALNRFQEKLEAKTEILLAGKSYSL